MRFCVALLLAALALPASAAPPPDRQIDPAIAAWYHSLKQPDTKEGCCDVSDCRVEPWRQRDGHFEVYIEETIQEDQFGPMRTGKYQWVIIPENKILQKTDNPEGDAVTCHSGLYIYCFVRPVEL